MFARQVWLRNRNLFVVCCALLVAVGLLSPSPAPAQSPLKDSTSLSFVADDVAFYGTSLRLKEQFDAFVASNAHAAIMNLPVVKKALKDFEEARQSPDGNMQQLNAFIENEEYADLRKLLADMFSNEVFLTGDSSYAEVLALFGTINSANRLGSLGGPNQDPLAQPRAILRALNESRDQLQVPGTLIGFRLNDPENGKRQLQNLEGLLTLLLGQNQQMADRFKKQTIDGSDFLTLALDGEMVPWEQVPIAQIEENPGEFDDLIAKFRTLTLTISLGVRDNYMLLGIAKNSDIVAKSQGTKLYDRKELAPLHQHEDKRITDINYLSADFAKKVGQMDQQLDDLVEMVEVLMPSVPFDDETRTELNKDVKQIRDDLKPYLPKPGAVMAFNFLNGRGYEGYTYDWAENNLLDGSKTLTLLDHVGGDPILYYAARAKYDPEQFNLLIRILKRGYYYLDKYASNELPDEEKDKYKTYRDAALPYLAKLETITKEKLVPCFKDGQGAIAIDAKAMSKQWTPFMEESDKPLPMIELALVYAINDASMLRAAMNEYFTVAQELLDALHEANADEVPQITVPEVTTETTPDGTVSTFEDFSNLPVDPQVRPNAGLSEEIAVLSITPAQTKRVLAKTSPDAKDGPLGDRDKPLASAARFNWPAFVDAAVPWVEYALKLNMGEDDSDPSKAGDDAEEKKDGGDDAKPEKDDDAKPEKEDDEDADEDDLESILAQVHTGAEILKCCRGYSSVSYFEDKVLVTHSECVMQDLTK